MMNYKIAPILLRGLVPKEVVQCFIDVWQWYKYAPRSKWVPYADLKNMEDFGDTSNFSIFLKYTT